MSIQSLSNEISLESVPLHTRINLRIPVITPPHHLQRTLHQPLPDDPRLVDPVRVDVIQLQRDLREDALGQPLALFVAVSRVRRRMPDVALT